MVNKKMLRSVMALHGETNRDLATLLGISEQSVSAKMNETGSEFKQGEISIIRAHYKLTPEQVTDIIASCDRTKAGPTAPAQGLTLVKIEYK